MALVSHMASWPCRDYTINSLSGESRGCWVMAVQIASGRLEPRNVLSGAFLLVVAAMALLQECTQWGCLRAIH